MSNGFHVACKQDDVLEGQMKLVEVDEQLVILFRVDGKFYCIDDICTHDGGTLSDGEIEGCEIECPRHGARFDVRNGKALTMPATQDTRSHEVKIVGDELQVKLSQA